MHTHILTLHLPESCKYFLCVLFSLLQVFMCRCVSQMQDALLSQFCAPTTALCAAPAMHQESKEQTASPD